MTFAVFHDFPGLENGPRKFHDFPGPVGTQLTFTFKKSTSKADNCDWLQAEDCTSETRSVSAYKFNNSATYRIDDLLRVDCTIEV